MRVELAEFGDAELLDVCSGFTILDAMITKAGARRMALPIVAATDAVLGGIRAELIRRWRQESGPACAVEMPIFDRFSRACIFDAFSTVWKYFEQRANFSSADAIEFMTGSARPARALVLAVSEPDVQSAVVN